MYWPRLQLTKNEAERWCIYSEPGKTQRPALYRTHSGELRITAQTPEDIETIQISKRARVVGLTASGDVHNIALQIYDSAGEQYTMGYTPLTNMLMGFNNDPRGMEIFDDIINPTLGTKHLSQSMVYGQSYCIAPHIFEPNIVLLPNQSLSIKGKALHPPVKPPNLSTEPGYSGLVFLSFTIHVWEFPVE